MSEHDGHTIDVGYVHVLTEPGGSCVDNCPHPTHSDPTPTAEKDAPCPCGHPADDHDDGACMHLCDCAWPPTAENGLALAALGRLADRAWNTAGDDACRERVREDRAVILAALTRPNSPAQAEAWDDGHDCCTYPICRDNPHRVIPPGKGDA